MRKHCAQPGLKLTMPRTKTDSMYIGALAELTGVTRKAIKHYEAMGLLPAPQRKGRYRFYTQSDADLICLIKRARELGFSLRDMTALIATTASQGSLPMALMAELIATKRNQLQADIRHAQRLDSQLAALQQELICHPGLSCSEPA